MNYRASPVFRRKWSSLYESLSDSKPPREKLMESYIERIPQIEQIVLAGDHTAWPRLEAFTLKERTYDHLAQPLSGSKPGEQREKVSSEKKRPGVTYNLSARQPAISLPDSSLTWQPHC